MRPTRKSWCCGPEPPRSVRRSTCLPPTVLPDTIAGLNNIPVMTRNGATTYLSEVAHVRDGFSPQTNVVRQNGERGVLVSVIKNAGSFTLGLLGPPPPQFPHLHHSLSADPQVTPFFHPSGFVPARFP